MKRTREQRMAAFYGERCATFGHGCASCEGWRIFDNNGGFVVPAYQAYDAVDAADMGLPEEAWPSRTP